jgi:hypothetical protein
LEEKNNILCPATSCKECIHLISVFVGDMFLVSNKLLTK